MKILSAVVFAAVSLMQVFGGDVIFESKGPVTDKTPGFRFADFDKKAKKYVTKPFADGEKGRLIIKKLRLPHKEAGKGAYFKYSFDCRYTFKGEKPLTCNQGVFFYDKKGKLLPDCYDTLYAGDSVRRYERVLYAWDEVDTVEIFFQKPWAMKEGDTCSLEIGNVKVETATWEDAVRYCDGLYSQLPPLQFDAPADSTALIPRTMEALKTGKPWRVVFLGDSIQQDTFHSQFHALVKRAYPQSNVEWILSMRGGTGCWYYILAENFFSYVVDHKPDLLVIGGISNYRQHDATPNGRDVGPTGNDAMIRVAKLARERLGCEVLIVNGALNIDHRPLDPAMTGKPLPKMGFTIDQYDRYLNNGFNYHKLKRMCNGPKIQWWDMTVPCYTWLFASELPHGHTSRDWIHSGERGKQIIARVMLEYFTSGLE